MNNEVNSENSSIQDGLNNQSVANNWQSIYNQQPQMQNIQHQNNPQLQIVQNSSNVQSVINQNNSTSVTQNNNMIQSQQNNINQQVPNQINYNLPPNNNLNLNNDNIKSKKKFFIIGGIALAVLLLIIILVLILGRNKESSRTVMIYMVGSNLESESGLGTVDLNSIDYDEIYDDNINVVLIAGGSENWNNNYIEEDETSIYELTENGYKKVKTQSIQNMGDSKVFSDYINYVYENYKTDEYDLIFWNHGGAITGSEFDDLSGDNLSLEEMKIGLSNSSFNKNNKLEAVVFRTCLNGTIEIADVFKDYSDYLVASEEITLGAPIASVLNFVNDVEPSDNGYDVGVKFIESYKEQISTLKQYYGSSEYIYSTYSVVDLSKIDNLVQSLNEFVSDINITENYNEIARVRSNLYQYAYSQASDPSYDMVDLYNLVEGLKELSPKKAEKVLSDLESTILYNWATNSSSRGISIYFPYNGSDDAKKYFLDIYGNLDSFNDYNTFITGFNLIQSNGIRSYSFTDNKTTLTTKDEKSDFKLELTDEQLKGYARAEYLVFMDKGNGYYWPVYKGKEVTLNGNVLSASINGSHLKVENDTGSFIVPLFETYNEKDYIKYSTAVILQNFSDPEISNWKTDSAQLSLILNKETKKVKVGSVVLNEKDKNKPNSVAVNLKDYEYITFGSMSHKLLDENGNFSWEVYENSSNGIFEGVEITIEELEDFKLSSFDDNNNYYAVFRIYDVNNNYYYSKLVKMN